MKKTIIKITALATVLLSLNACGGKAEWETLADDYCGCIDKALEIKKSDPAKYIEEFKKCQDMTIQHQTKLTDVNQAHDYRTKVNACVDKAYK